MIINLRKANLASAQAWPPAWAWGLLWLLMRPAAADLRSHRPAGRTRWRKEPESFSTGLFFWGLPLSLGRHSLSNDIQGLTLCVCRCANGAERERCRVSRLRDLLQPSTDQGVERPGYRSACRLSRFLLDTDQCHIQVKKPYGPLMFEQGGSSRHVQDRRPSIRRPKVAWGMGSLCGRGSEHCHNHIHTVAMCSSDSLPVM